MDQGAQEKAKEEQPSRQDQNRGLGSGKGQVMSLQDRSQIRLEVVVKLKDLINQSHKEEERELMDWKELRRWRRNRTPEVIMG